MDWRWSDLPSDERPAPGRLPPRRRRAEGWQPLAVSDTHRAIDAVWRIESARLIGGLARIVRDVGLAEDLAQDALVAALEQWPKSGVPDNPGAWLMAAAKHHAIDLFRRHKRLERKHRSWATSSSLGERRRGRARPRTGRRCGGRSSASCLHRVPSGAPHRSARGPHAPAAGWPDDRGDRASVPRPRTDHRPAHRPGKADARQGASVLRGSPPGRARGPSGVRTRGHLPDFQRGLHGNGRRRLDAAGPLRGCAAPRAHPGRARPGRGRRCTA